MEKFIYTRQQKNVAERIKEYKAIAGSLLDDQNNEVFNKLGIRTSYHKNRSMNICRQFDMVSGKNDFVVEVHLIRRDRQERINPFPVEYQNRHLS
ncbi:hypothetical protein [Succinimonas amylolytica]|uniref:hypothetical protein n=1 Tax=Succinimonas amylolytica TaxID=83769 RepID=UPI0023A86F91